MDNPPFQIQRTEPQAQPDGSLLPSDPPARTRMGLDEMLNYNTAESLLSGPSQPAYNQTPSVPGYYQNTYRSFADHSVYGHGYMYHSPYTPAGYPVPHHSPRSRPTSRSHAHQLPELPPFVHRTEFGSHGLGDTARRLNYPSQYHHSAPHYRPDYAMSHEFPGSYNSYLPAPPPPHPPHPHSMAQVQFVPPQFAHESPLHAPDLPGYVPQYHPTQRQHSDPPQAYVPPPLRTCNLCLEHLDDKASNFPFSCPQCGVSQYCATCLKGWFIDACKNESKMPPKCCGAIPLSTVKKSMTNEQMGLYKAKFEEWMTPDKIYCPIKTCSAFIPPRLFQKPRKITPVQDDIPAANPGDPIATDSQALPAAEVKINAACPKCTVQVCTKCRSIAHDGACVEELDPDLAEQLKKWKVKRCPRCRTGIRKVYGCSHVECRCGAHFCWECLQPADECGGACDDDAHDDSGVESDDVDGLAGYFEGDGHEFGPEPENEFTVVWNCPHIFDSPRSALPEDAECYCCFRPVMNIVSDAPGIVQGPSEGVNGNVEEVDKEVDAVKAWQCHRCAMVTCGNCKGTFEDDPGHSG